MTPRITDEMRQALLEHPGEPVTVEDDETHARYVLIAWDQFAPFDSAVDKDRLREAILARRDESRRLNAEWEHADREVWQHAAPDDQ